jgi:hypothetical protein
MIGGRQFQPVQHLLAQGELQAVRRVFIWTSNAQIGVALRLHVGRSESPPQSLKSRN